MNLLAPHYWLEESFWEKYSSRVNLKKKKRGDMIRNHRKKKLLY